MQLHICSCDQGCVADILWWFTFLLDPTAGIWRRKNFLLLLFPREERSGREGGVGVRNVTSSRFKQSGGCMCRPGIDQRDWKERRLWVLGTLVTEMVGSCQEDWDSKTDRCLVCFLYQGGCLAHFLYSWRRFCFALTGWSRNWKGKVMGDALAGAYRHHKWAMDLICHTK